MSYSIIRGIRIDDDQKEVAFKHASNNVSPRIYRWETLPFFTELWQESGRDAVMADIITAYIDGAFQAGIDNKFSRAAAYMKSEPRYKKYTEWSDEGKELRKSEQYRKICKMLLGKNVKPVQYVVKVDGGYMWTRKNGRYYETRGRNKAKKYDEETAQRLARHVEGTVERA